MIAALAVTLAWGLLIVSLAHREAECNESEFKKLEEHLDEYTKGDQ